MPVELPYEKDPSERGLEDELFRWRNEFSMRNGNFDKTDNDDAVGTAVRILDGDWEENKEFIQQVKDEFRQLKSENTSSDRLSLMHTTIGNLHVAEDIPDSFVYELVDKSADYINGFMPGQEITSPETTALEVIDRAGAKGDYDFNIDRVRVSPDPGRVRDGSSALALAAHEVIHRNNVEAVVHDTETVRDMAWIYHNSLPEDYRATVEDTDVAECEISLLAGLALQRIEDETGFQQAHVDDRRDDIKGPEYLDVFEEAVSEIKDEYSLDEFDVRDETIAKAVTYFIEGTFEQGFKSELRDTKFAYNQNEHYSENAGERIAEYLEAFKEEYESRDGFRGERFKSTMENRVPFLEGEYEFGS